MVILWSWLPTCKLYFIFLNAVHRESPALTGMQKLSHKDCDLQIVLNVSRSFQGSSPEMIVRFAGDLEVISTHPRLLHAKLNASKLDE